MKKFKNIVLLGLLFAFTFVVVHDYVIEFFDEGSECELSYLTCDISPSIDKGSLDLASQIHDNIHTLLGIYTMQQIPIVSIPPKINPHAIEIASTLSIDFVLERPTLL